MPVASFGSARVGAGSTRDRELASARKRIARLERRLETVTSTRWWRARELIRDAVRSPSALVLLVPRLVRLALAGGAPARPTTPSDRATAPAGTAPASDEHEASDDTATTSAEPQETGAQVCERLRRANEERPPGQARVAPCDAPRGTGGRVVAVLGPGGRSPGWLDEVAAVTRELGAACWLLSDAAPQPATADAIPVSCLDDADLRASAFRAADVVLAEYGPTVRDAGPTAGLVAEAAATGAAVVAHDPDGLREDLDHLDAVALAPDAAGVARYARFLLVNPEMAERAGAAAATAAHARSATTSARPQVSAVIATLRPHCLEQAVAAVDAQRGVDVQLVVVGHGFDPEEEAIRARLGDGAIGEVVTRRADPQLSLGEVTNLGFEAGDAPLLAKMDDDDLYGPGYLQEQALAVDYAGADVVGKWTWHMYLSTLDVTVLRRPGHEHLTHPHVSGATMVMTREAFAANPFPARQRGEDIELLRRAVELEQRIYATSRFNFAAVRHAGDHGHTWRADDLEVATRGADDRARFVGPATDQIFL